jgi:hypothetical protein
VRKKRRTNNESTIKLKFLFRKVWNLFIFFLFWFNNFIRSRCLLS